MGCASALSTIFTFDARTVRSRSGRTHAELASRVIGSRTRMPQTAIDLSPPGTNVVDACTDRGSSASRGQEAVREWRRRPPPTQRKSVGGVAKAYGVGRPVDSNDRRRDSRAMSTEIHISDSHDGTPTGSLELRVPLCSLSAPPESALLDARFRFTTQDPCAVRMELRRPDGHHVVWDIGRDLLRSGMSGLSGEGAVKIWPSRAPDRAARLYLRLQQADCHVTLVGDRAPLRRWLRQTYMLVPADMEHIALDLDGLARQLLTPSDTAQ
ncbi:SsgA family sporulation/cell division regulator [Streptomyces bauhiniae]|uniref:SsgA family sporulation/cell division regulator n=1 Tax=Streptomyces bauhiniae TaxID=2340725 RepID=UPI0035DC96DA